MSNILLLKITYIINIVKEKIKEFFNYKDTTMWSNYHLPYINLINYFNKNKKEYYEKEIVLSFINLYNQRFNNKKISKTYHSHNVRAAELLIYYIEN
jgi:hypothetical protein